MIKSQVKRGGMRKHGRNTEKCKRYRNAKTRERNKLKRIVKSNGCKEAKKYSLKYNLVLKGCREN